MTMKRTIIAVALLALSTAASAKEVVPFIENDYSKALAQARTKNKPIFVDAWAPW